MSDPTNTQISMNVAIAVLHAHTARSKGLPKIYGHYQELAEVLIQHIGDDAVDWANDMLGYNS